MLAQRLDKWLWCTRLAKTRSGAQRAIEAGKVRINGTRALKASRLVQPGDVVTATLLGKLSVVRVLAAAERRGPAALARNLYEDLTPKAQPEPERAQHQGGPRPTKRDRRRIDALRGSDF
jgi:ribosome-associated heat shock protein Hsp15